MQKSDFEAVLIAFLGFKEAVKVSLCYLLWIEIAS